MISDRKPARATRFSVIAAAVTLGVAILVATLVIHDGKPACPLDSVPAPETNYTMCYRSVNPTDAPSSIEVFPVSEDQKTQERLLVVAIGALGAVFLVALGLRIPTRRE